MPSCGSNASMETPTPLIDAIINNTLLHSNSHISQMMPQIIHMLHFLHRLVASDFVIYCIKVRAVQRPEI